MSAAPPFLDPVAHLRPSAAVAVGLGLAVALACAPPAKRPQLPPSASPSGSAIGVRATPVPLDPGDRTKDRAGDFVYAGGLDLTSPDTDRLHGLSDLKIDANGWLTAVGDQGDLFRARLVLDQDGRLADLADARLEPLGGPDGRPLSGKAKGDAEGLAIWPNGDRLVSFERDHRIWLYLAGGGAPRPVAMPRVEMPENGGMEGLALAPKQGADAYWVGIERGDVFLCRLAQECQPVPGLPRPEPGWRLSALAETPAGQLVLLHHTFTVLGGSRIHLWLIEPPQAETAPQVVAELALDPPQTVDNFEGVAAVDRRGGGLRLYLLADDNFQSLERTLLLAFDWQAAAGKSAG